MSADQAAELRAQAEAERHAGRLDDAIRTYESVIGILRDTGHRLRLAHAIRHLGDIHRGRRDAEAAAPCYVEAIEIYRSESDARVLDVANAFRGFALLKQQMEANAEAAVLWQQASDLYARCEVWQGVANSRGQLAMLSWRAGDRHRARELLEQGFAAAAKCEDPRHRETLERIGADISAGDFP